MRMRMKKKFNSNSVVVIIQNDKRHKSTNA